MRLHAQHQWVSRSVSYLLGFESIPQRMSLHLQICLRQMKDRIRESSMQHLQKPTLRRDEEAGTLLTLLLVCHRCYLTTRESEHNDLHEWNVGQMLISREDIFCSVAYCLLTISIVLIFNLVDATASSSNCQRKNYIRKTY